MNTASGQSLGASTGEMVIGGGLILGIIGFCLPWFSIDIPGSTDSITGITSPGFGAHWSGFHWWGVLFAIYLVVTIAYVLLRYFRVQGIVLPAMPIEDWQMLFVDGIVLTLLVLQAWLTFEGFNNLSVGGVSSGSGDGVGASYGLYITLVGSILVAVGGVLQKPSGPIGSTKTARAVSMPPQGFTPPPNQYAAPPPPSPATESPYLPPQPLPPDPPVQNPGPPSDSDPQSN